MALEGHRRPLVLSATRAASERARELGVSGVLENVVEREIAGGNVSHRPTGPHDLAKVPVAPGVLALVAAARAPSGRRAWQPVDVVTAGRR